MIADTEWLKKSTALIRFSLEEMQNLIISLVLAESSANNLSQTEYAENFKKLRKDIVRIKNDLQKKEREHEENRFKTR